MNLADAVQMNLEDVVRIFHEPDCPGVIVRSPSGISLLRNRALLICAECGQNVGTLDLAVYSQLLELLRRVPSTAPPAMPYDETRPPR